MPGLSKAVERGKATADEREAVDGPDHRRRGLRLAGRLRSGDRVGGRGDRGQAGAVRRARSSNEAIGDPGDQHLDLPVIDLALATARPEQVCGIHFFNPATVMKLVEVVRPLTACAETIDSAMAFVDRRAARTRSRCRTTPGSSSTRCCSRTSTTRCACSSEARRPIESIDTAMKGGCNFPMGPFALLDLVGLDTSVAILETIHASFGNPSRRAGADAARQGRGRPSRSQDQAAVSTPTESADVFQSVRDAHGSTYRSSRRPTAGGCRRRNSPTRAACVESAPIWSRARCWPRIAAGSSRCRFARRPWAGGRPTHAV